MAADRRGAGDADLAADDVVAAAADELYRADPAGFVARRAELARAARGAGDRVAASAIAALPRPTLAAWVVNRWALTHDDVARDLVGLAAELHRAQTGLDGDALRELSDRRRSLVAAAARQAFADVGRTRPPAGLAAEVQDTLTAAVLDPDVGAAVVRGRLLRAARASGFGPGGPDLAIVGTAGTAGAGGAAAGTGSAAGPRRARARSHAARRDDPEPTGGSAPDSRSGSASRSGSLRRPGPTESAADRRRRERAERAERDAASRRAQAVATAEATLSTARTAAEQAAAARQEVDTEVAELTDRLHDAHRRQGDAGLAVREAKAAVRRAEQDLRAARRA